MQNNQRSARNLSVIARTPAKPLKYLQNPSKTFEAIFTCMCTPVGPLAFLSDSPPGRSKGSLRALWKGAVSTKGLSGE
eukprot:12629438-Heterocapsa_arctica.AAC.1